MNKKEALRRLFEILEASAFSVHPELIGEIMNLIKQSGMEAAFFTMLITRLKMLCEHRTDAHILASRNFEHLDQGIYSMHLQTGQFNIRILYALEQDQTVLLHAFYERQGKNKTDYTGKINLALARLKELEL